jgi:hypothetical protein
MPVRPGKRARQIAGAPRFDQEPGLAIGDELREGPDPGRDHGEAAGVGLDQHHREALVPDRRQDKGPCTAQLAKDRLAVEMTKRDDTFTGCSAHFACHWTSSSEATRNPAIG